jgi:hypothetical protein
MAWTHSPTYRRCPRVRGRLKDPRLVDALATAVRDLDYVLVQLQHIAQAIGGVLVVIDDEDAVPRGSAASAALGHRLARPAEYGLRGCPPHRS